MSMSAESREWIGGDRCDGNSIDANASIDTKVIAPTIDVSCRCHQRDDDDDDDDEQWQETRVSSNGFHRVTFLSEHNIRNENR